MLKHGTGGINIDGCRIGYSDSNDCFQDRLHCGSRSSWNAALDGSLNKPVRTSGSPAGRWPANLILCHHLGCHLEGSKRIRGSHQNKQVKDLYPGASVTKMLRGYSIPGVNQHVDPDGLETVDSWTCQEDCPVAYLDHQSGVSVSTGGRAYQNTNDMYSGGWSHKDRGWAVNPGFGDVGGASRFFKQVQSKGDSK